MKRYSLAILLTVALVSTVAEAAVYNYKTLNYPSSNAGTAATGINATGTVVGYWFDNAQTLYRGFKYVKGQYSAFQFPGASATWPDAINKSGSIVGYYNAKQRTHGFLLEKGKYTTLDFPAG